MVNTGRGREEVNETEIGTTDQGTETGTEIGGVREIGMGTGTVIILLDVVTPHLEETIRGGPAGEIRVETEEGGIEVIEKNHHEIEGQGRKVTKGMGTGEMEEDNADLTTETPPLAHRRSDALLQLPKHPFLHLPSRSQPLLPLSQPVSQQ